MMTRNVSANTINSLRSIPGSCCGLLNSAKSVTHHFFIHNPPWRRTHSFGFAQDPPSGAKLRDSYPYSYQGIALAMPNSIYYQSPFRGGDIANHRIQPARSKRMTP
jgi:hypothetical protein